MLRASLWGEAVEVPAVNLTPEERGAIERPRPESPEPGSFEAKDAFKILWLVGAIVNWLF